MCASDIKNLNEHLQTLMDQSRVLYGGLDVVFMGDFSQLPAIRGTQLYERTPICVDWFDGINTFIELHGRWRFKDDPEYGEVCWRFHEGRPTDADFDLLDKRWIGGSGEELPAGISYAVYSNRERDTINTAVFLDYIQNKDAADKAIIVLASDPRISSKNGPRRLSDPVNFWSKCGESDTNDPKTRTRLDPALKAYPGAPVMLLSNTDVLAGEANGATGKLGRIHIRPGAERFPIVIHGITVMGVLAKDVTATIKLDGGQHANPFRVMKPKSCSFQCKLPLPPGLCTLKNQIQHRSMIATQLPFVSNKNKITL
jgi:hypothetical protein